MIYQNISEKKEEKNEINVIEYEFLGGDRNLPVIVFDYLLLLLLSVVVVQSDIDSG